MGSIPIHDGNNKNWYHGDQLECSLCDCNSIIFIILVSFPLLSFMTATLMAKMDIMVTTAVFTLQWQRHMEMFEKTCRCRHSVNEPLVVCIFLHVCLRDFRVGACVGDSVCSDV